MWRTDPPTHDRKHRGRQDNWRAEIRGDRLAYFRGTAKCCPAVFRSCARSVCLSWRVDTTFAAESLRLEALDEDGARRQHEPEVIEVEDRAEGSAALAGLW